MLLQDLIKSFLRRGANMGVKNFRERTAVQSILPDTLREFLDEDCIDHAGVITDEHFKLTFKYDFLAPPLLNEDMLPPPRNEEEAAREQGRKDKDEAARAKWRAVQKAALILGPWDQLFPTLRVRAEI